MKDQKVNIPGHAECRQPGRPSCHGGRLWGSTLRLPLLAVFMVVTAVAGFATGLLAQSINWSDPQSPILKAVVMHQRLASEREVGNILVLRGGRPFAGVTRMTLVAGDSLVTGDQTAIIGYADQSWEAVVHPSTQVDFRGGEVKVAFGRMYAQIMPTEQQLLPIAVTSAYGSITGGDGSFELDVTEERAVLTVISGSIELTRPSTAPVTLRELDEVVLVADAPLVTRPISGVKYREIGDRIAALSDLGVVAAPETAQPQAVVAKPAPAAATTTQIDGQAEAAAQTARNKSAQALLNDLGYDAGPPDGVAGPRTLRAVAAFRLDRQLPGTTEIDAALLEALRSAPPRPSLAAKTPAPKPVERPSVVTPTTAAPAPAPARAASETQEVTIPNLIGLEFDRARVQLEQNQHLIGRVIYQASAGKTPGTVLQQWPLPGDRSRRGGSVDLVIVRAETANDKNPDDVMPAEAVAAALGAAPPPPPPPQSAKPTTSGTSENGFLGSKGYLGSRDEVAGLFRPEQKLSSSDTSGSNFLSRDELSACLRIEDDYLAQKLRVAGSNQKQDATADEIAALDVKLDEILPKTDPNKPETLEAYNTLLDQRLQLFSEYKDKILPEARQNERQLRAIQRSFQADCGGRPYRAEDLEAARKAASLN